MMLEDSVSEEVRKCGSGVGRRMVVMERREGSGKTEGVRLVFPAAEV